MMKNTLPFSLKPRMALTSCFVVTCFFIGKAQSDLPQYDFSTFKLPDIHVRGLQVSGDAFGRIQNENAFGSDVINATFDLDYFGFRNSVDLQRQVRILGSADISWDKLDPSVFYDKRFGFGPAISGSHESRAYREKNFKQLTLGYYAFAGISHDREDDRHDREFRTHVDLHPEFLLGHGRIEPINFVTIANFLVEDLALQGLLNGTISNDDLNRLGQRMAQASYARRFDFREKFKYELKQIDQFIDSTGLVSEDGIDYFSSLADNWIYDFRTGRRHGNRFSYGLSPRLEYASTNSKFTAPGSPESTSNTHTTTLGIYAIAEYRHEKAKSVKWQNSAGVRAEVGYYDRMDDLPGSSSFSANGPDGLVSMFIGKGFYPNSRTAWTNDAYIGLRGLSRDADFNMNVVGGIRSQINYFISHRIRFVGSLSANWSDQSINAVIPFTHFPSVIPALTFPVPIFTSSPFLTVSARIVYALY